MCISASTEWLGNIRKRYKEDAIFGPVVRNLSNSTMKEKEKKPTSKQDRRISERAKSYTLEESLLYHKPLGGKLYIPKPLRADVIREANDSILGSGHNGVAKTAAAVSAQYHWPKLIDSVAEWVARCDTCHRVKHKNARPYGLLNALPIPLKSTERINIDFVTKLLMSETGYNAVATIIDPLTKHAW